MKLQETIIRNFRGIEEWHLLFKPGFNLIKGKNGKGKTSVLEALAVGLGGYITGMDGVSSRQFSKDEIRRIYTSSGEGAYSVEYKLPTQVVMTADMENEEGIISWTHGRTSIQATRGTIQPRKIVQLAEKMFNQPDTLLPLICYQGAGRVWSQKREKTENIFRKKYLRTVGYKDALLEASNIKLLLNWCVRMEQVSFQKEKKIAEYEAVKKAVADFMSRMNGGEKYEVFYDKQSEDLMFAEKSTVLPITDLSAGYQSLIWMVFDIAYRMALLNPFLLDKITETSGIILIDELDMHLHPRWQWKVIDALRETFPNIQFIASTHAPILFASAKDVWLIDIEGEEIGYSWSHYGIDVNTSVKHFQGKYELPEDIQLKSDQFYKAMDQEDYPEAGRILQDLIEKTAPEFPLIVDMKTMYDLEVNWPEE